MSDKDQFTFDDDDDFPETDLDDQDEPQGSALNDDDDFPGSDPDDVDESQGFEMGDDDDFPETDLTAAFADGEHTADGPVPDEPVLKVKSGGNSRTRTLLVVLLLVVAGGAGAYYFMDLGGTTPSVPTVPVPAQTGTRSIALPPQPAQAPAAQETAESAAKPASVTVPPPPLPAESKAQTAPAESPAAAVSQAVAPVTRPEEQPIAEKPAAEAVKQPATQVAVPAQQPQAAAAKPAPEPAPVKQMSAALTVTQAIEPTKPDKVPMQVAGGAYALDAGSYLMESNRDSLVAKIKQLGYEPLVTPINATLDMTRLRLGTFGKDEVQEALDFARSIEPGSYSTPAGDRYVIYAGTFLKSHNINKLSQRFLAEGIKVYPEPVQVVRTLSRIRFGSFATKEDAATAAQEAGEVGLKAVVVQSK